MLPHQYRKGNWGLEESTCLTCNWIQYNSIIGDEYKMKTDLHKKNMQLIVFGCNVLPIV